MSCSPSQDGGDGVGGGGGLGGEEVGEGASRGIGGGGVVPVDQRQVALGGGEQGQRGDGQAGIGDDARQQRLGVPHHPGDGGALEEVRVVLEAPDDAFRPVIELDGEIELRRADIDVQLAHRPRHIERRERRLEA